MNLSLSVRDRARFQKRVVKASGCWEWRGAHNGNGYGLFWLPELRKYTTTHRAAWVVYKGPIPEKLHVLHHCDNPGCVNPDHLFLGVQQDNMHDAKKKRRFQQGEQHYRAKFTSQQIREIRQAYAGGVRLYQLAAKYQVDRMTIKAIVTYVTWKGVK